MSDDDEAIRLRAYRLWESEGRPNGRDEAHWQQASRELRADGGHPVIKPSRKRSKGTESPTEYPVNVGRGECS